MHLLARRSGGVQCRGSAIVLAAIIAVLIVASAVPAASASNRAMSWGYNAWGVLGNGNGAHYERHEIGNFPGPSPSPVCGMGTIGECPVGPYLSDVSAVSASDTFSLALLSNGTVVAWGENERGQLGDGTNTGPNACVQFRGVHYEYEEFRPCSATSVAVSGLSGVTAIAAGGNHSLVLLSNGTVMAWGVNGNGQLGDGTTKDSDVPVAVSGLSGVIAISAGPAHSLALLSNGTVMAWGANEWGQLGDGTTTDKHMPVAVSGLSAVTAVSAAGGHSLAILSDGTARSWGGNGYGLLGDGSTESEQKFSDLPVVVSGLSGVAAVSAGLEDNLALLSNGTVMSWGHDTLGAGGSIEFADVPVEVCAVDSHYNFLYPPPPCTSGPYLSGVTAVSSGPNHDMALLNTGAVVAWGGPELGNATTGSSNVPVEVSGLSDVSGISAGNEYSLSFGPVAPAVTGVSPTQGLEAGGTTVTIAGTNFTEGATVAFGSMTATKVTVNSSSSITAVSPAGTGTVDVTVTTSEGTSSTGPADRFKYIPVPPPTIAKIKPAKGSVAGGTAVTITGASFTEVLSVKFGSVEAAHFTVNSPTSITAIAPEDAVGPVELTVTTPIGTSATSSKDRFKFTPLVTGVSPPTGSATGGSSVTITGAGFGLAVGKLATKFKFGTASATSVSCSTSTTCTAVAPAHAVGKVDVVAIVNKTIGSKNPPVDQYTYE